MMRISDFRFLISDLPAGLGAANVDVDGRNRG